MLTILLAKVFGLYLIIGGVAIWARQREFMPIIGAFIHDRVTRLVVALVELMAGLFLVVSHNVWTTFPEAVVTIFGWCLLLEGAFYMLASDEVVERHVKMLNKKGWYTFGGIFGVILGIYLAGYGFGWF